MPRYRVTGPWQISGVGPGGVVDLDPAKINVDVLVNAGLVQPVDDPPPRPRRNRDSNGAEGD